jgi:hypothetical protein
VNGVPVFVLTHTPPPANTVPKGPSNLTFVTDGIASAIRQGSIIWAVPCGSRKTRLLMVHSRRTSGTAC